MKQPEFDSSWSESCVLSYPYDLMEVYGVTSCRGYTYAYQNRSQRTISEIQRLEPVGAKILDVAAAQGNFSLRLAELGYHVTWNDLREDLIPYIKLKYEKGNLSFAPGDAFDLGLGPVFDIVLITEIIEHVAHPDAFLRKISDLVRPGGHIVMTTPNGAYFLNRLPKFSECADPSQYESVQFKPNSDGHIFLLYSDEVRLLAEAAGLVVEKLSTHTNPLTNGHRGTEKLLRFLPYRLVERIESRTSANNGLRFQRYNTAMLAVLEKPIEQ
jgi:2-polyprenyl-6-hydroxyphenyl methylase/3-demethylubiquinone-9 3-methyltransferase